MCSAKHCPWHPSGCGTVPYLSIVVNLHSDARKTVINTVIAADTQCRMLSPTVITNITIHKYGTVLLAEHALTMQPGLARQPYHIEALMAAVVADVHVEHTSLDLPCQQPKAELELCPLLFSSPSVHEKPQHGLSREFWKHCRDM